MATTTRSAGARAGTESATGSSRLDDVRERLSEVGSDVGERVGAAPLIALGAGAALGALIASVLPRTDKETELLRPLGTKLNEAGRGALDRGREMGREKFNELAGDKVREFFGAKTAE